MDTQQLQQATSQLQKLTHSNVGEYELAITTSPKIKDSLDEEIKKVLRFAMILVGIRAATINSMDEEEKQILIGFVKSKFGWFAVDEIKIAFTKACAGELDVDARPFENFTCEYIGRIMKSYKDWAMEERQKLSSKRNLLNYKKYEKVETSSDGIELANMYYQEFLNDSFNFKMATSMAWEMMKQRFGIVFSPEKNNEIIKQAKLIYLADKEEIIQTHSPERSPYYTYAKRDKSEVEQTEEGSLLSISGIRIYCQRLGLLEWFRQLKEKNVTSIFEYKKQFEDEQS